MNEEDELGERSVMGVIALLTGKAYQRARVIQRWLREKHGISQPAFYQPHVTFVIGQERGDREAIIQGLGALARETDPIEILTTGLGIFPSPTPVLYLSIPRRPELADLNRAILTLFQGAGGGNQPNYRPENWMPHVTLASKGLSSGLLATMIEGILQRPLHLTSRLACLALVEEVEKERWVSTFEFPLRGENELGPNPYGLTSRPCQPSDRLFVCQLVEEMLKPLISAFFPWDQVRTEQNWEASWRKKVIVLAAGRPVGYFQYDTSPAEPLYVGNLFLTPAVQGQGWGGWLLGHMEGMAAGRPVRLHVWENNPAVGFYRHHGYRVIETVGHKHLMEKT